MRVLITGASGQIGTNLGLRLLARGDEVRGVDKRPNTWTSAFDVHLVDLAAPGADSAVGAAMAGWTPEVVVHLAAHAKVHELVVHPARALENVAMVQAALEYCRASKVPILFSSSREVYGNVTRDTTREEDASLGEVASPYAASKMAGEALVRSYGRCYGLPWAVCRLSNVYGRYDDDLARMERVIPLFRREIAAGRPITVYGADKVLDFTHVDDCVEGLVSAMQALCAGQVKAEVFNLARGQGHSLVQMAQWLGELLGRAPMLRIEAARPGEVQRYVADTGRARAVLGFAPRIGLRQGLEQSIQKSAA